MIIRSYIPQHEFLPWCDAVVAHGGSGTVLGALAHGLPLLVVPAVYLLVDGVKRRFGARGPVEAPTMSAPDVPPAAA